MTSVGLPYNGWPAFIRHGHDRHYYHARNNGLLLPATACLCCGVSFVGPVPYHAEEYGPTLEDYWQACVPLCHRCHAMAHTRFKTPNRWKRFISQAAAGAISEEEFPNSTHIAALLSRYGKRQDIEETSMPETAAPYLRSLPMVEYSGPEKVATLLVQDQISGDLVELPDWTLYGPDLESLGKDARAVCEARGLDIGAVLSRSSRFQRNTSGQLVYKRLYAMAKDA